MTHAYVVVFSFSTYETDTIIHSFIFVDQIMVVFSLLSDFKVFTPIC